MEKSKANEVNSNRKWFGQALRLATIRKALAKRGYKATVNRIAE
jgi:hypothetical protein